MLKIPQFETKSELYDYLQTNKEGLISQKKFENKYADAVSYSTLAYIKGEAENKAISTTEQLLESDKIKVELVINTTKLMDSHGDVHVNGIWTKSISESKNIPLLQEHEMSFDKIIAEDVTVTAKTINWKTLGFDFAGTTQALVFNTEIEKDRNTFMFNQYAKGYVKQHSVGMRYVQIKLAVNSDDAQYTEEKAVFDKYYSEIANKEAVDAQGYFWAVTEAKVIEGSAVVKGSNFATPTQSVQAVKNIEPSEDTQPEPPEGTQKLSIYSFN